MRGVVYALPLLVLLTSGVQAAPSEVAVSYLVDARALRALAVSHHVLTFELYADAQCQKQLHRESVAAARIEVGVAYVRRAASRSGRAATLQAVLHPPRAQRGVFLVVRGPAVRPVGDSCQFQSLGL